MSDQTAFEREVDEEVRQDQFIKLWKTYGPYMIGAIVAGLVVTSISMGIQSWRESSRASASDDFQAALEAAATQPAAESVAAFQSLRGAAGGYDLLARFQEAEFLVRDSKIEEAVAVYEGIAKSGGEKLYRSLGALKAAYLMIDREEPDAFLARLQPQLDEDNPWAAFVGELRATLFLRQGDLASAQEAFAALSEDADAPSGLRNRAVQMKEFVEGALSSQGVTGGQTQAAPAGNGETSEQGENP